MYVHMYVGQYVCLPCNNVDSEVQTYILTDILCLIYVCIYIYRERYMCIYIYMYIYVYIHIHTQFCTCVDR